MWKKRKAEIISGCLIIAFLVGIFQWNREVQKQYQHFANENISYVKGLVTETSNENLERDATDPNRYIGLQQVKVKILEGELEGETVSIDNYLTASSNINVSEGMRVIVSVDHPEDAEPYCLIYNYYRSPWLGIMTAAFFLCMAAVGGKKGLRAIAGLVFTLLTIMLFLLPFIYVGYSPVTGAVITVVITAAVSLLLLNGFSKKTLAAVISTSLGTILVGVIFGIFSYLLKISGYTIDETEFMVYVASNTKLQVGRVLFAGVLISSLGAIMDVGMSIASALYEIKETDTQRTAKQLVISGLNIGKDMIGTMSNTLILAFTGNCLGTLLVLATYGIKLHQFLNSDFIAVEMAQGLSGSMAVILTVPITSLVSSWIYTKRLK